VELVGGEMGQLVKADQRDLGALPMGNGAVELQMGELDCRVGALAAAPELLALLIGNSGVSKSSLAKAGVVASLMRQAWPETDAPDGPWPPAFRDSRRWYFLKLFPGTEPVRALVEPFLRTWQFDPVDPARARLLSDWRAGPLAAPVSHRRASTGMIVPAAISAYGKDG